MLADELLLPKWRDNPYPLYAELRALAPVHWGERLNAWVLTRYVDVAAALRDPRLSSQRASNTAFSNVPEHLQEEVAPFKQSLSQWVLFRDPPDHTRVRALLNKALVPGLVETLRPQIQRIAHELLKGPMEQGRLAVVRELAFPLPAIVIAELLGMPRADRERFKRFSNDLATLLPAGPKDAKRLEDGLQSWQEMDSYLRDRIAARRKAGTAATSSKDMLSALLSAEEGGSLLSEEEVRATIGLLLFAGHETTTNLIANGVLLLLSHPEARAALRKEPALLTTAIEEMLRYESPVQMFRRIVVEDLVLAGQTMRKGQAVLLLLASANRDPAQFPEPDRFQIQRRENRHLSFGFGIHFCLGATLARLEAQLALGTLFDRWPDMALHEQPIVWRDNLAFRCPVELHVSA